MDLAEIQHAIEDLPEDQRTALASWVAERDRAHWDEQIARDFSPGGAGMEWLERVKRQVKRGQSRPLSEGRVTTRKAIAELEAGKGKRFTDTAALMSDLNTGD